MRRDDSDGFVQRDWRRLGRSFPTVTSIATGDARSESAVIRYLPAGRSSRQVPSADAIATHGEGATTRKATIWGWMLQNT